MWTDMYTNKVDNCDKRVELCQLGGVLTAILNHAVPAKQYDHLHMIMLDSKYQWLTLLHIWFAFLAIHCSCYLE